MPSPRRKGLTLVEVLISAGLLSLILISVYAALVLATRFYGKVRHASDVQQQTLTVLNQVQRSLNMAARRSLQVTPNGVNTDITFISAQGDGVYMDVDNAGLPKWQKAVCFFVEPRGAENFALVMTERKLGAPTTTLPSTPSVSSMRSQRPVRVLTEDLKSFSVTPGFVFLRIQLGIESEAPIGSNTGKLVRDGMTLQTGLYLTLD